MEDNLKNENDSKNEVNLKNKDNLKNEYNFKNENNLRNEDNLKNEDNLIFKPVLGPSLLNLCCGCFYYIVGASNRPTKTYSCLFDFFAVVSLDPFAGASYSCTGSEIVCQEFFLKTRLSLIESLPKKVVVIVVGVVFVVHGLVVVIGVVVIVGDRNLTLKFGQNWVDDQ